jgi:hypothetical protein
MQTGRRRTDVPALLIATSIGLAASAQGSVQPSLRIFDVTTAHVTIEDQTIETASVFAPDDNPLYVRFRAEGCTSGTTITSIWYYLATNPPLRFAVGSVTVEIPDGWGQFAFELPPGRRWRVGEYRVELRVDGALLADTTFRVAADDQSDLPSPARGAGFSAPVYGNPANLTHQRLECAERACF